LDKTLVVSQNWADELRIVTSSSAYQPPISQDYAVHGSKITATKMPSNPLTLPATFTLRRLNETKI
jgi:hypothetical protein